MITIMIAVEMIIVMIMITKNNNHNRDYDRISHILSICTGCMLWWQRSNHVLVITKPGFESQRRHGYSSLSRDETLVENSSSSHVFSPWNHVEKFPLSSRDFRYSISFRIKRHDSPSILTRMFFPWKLFFFLTPVFYWTDRKKEEKTSGYERNERKSTFARVSKIGPKAKRESKK